MAFQLRRGTNAQRTAITPLQGELLYTTDTKNLYIGDGTTAGGVIVSGGSGGGTVVTYGLSAETIAGGANLSLTGTDASADNVKLAAGANVTITRTDANTITISSTGSGGGASNIDDLGDVVITGTPTDGDVLTWDSAISTWVNGPLPTPPIEYTDVDAVDAVALAFSNGTLTGIDITYNPLDSSIDATVDLDHVATMLVGGVNTGITFAYDPLTDTLTSTVEVALGELTDVVLGTAVAGDLLRFDGTIWEASPEATWSLADDLTPTLSNNLDLSGEMITGAGNIDITGGITVTSDIVTNGGSLVVASESIQPAPSILDVLSFNAAGGVAPLFTIYKARGTAATPVVVTPGDVVGGMRFIGQGSDVTSQTQLASATVVGAIDPTGTIATTYAPGALLFQTRNDAGTLNTVFVLNKDGIMKVADNTVLPAAVDEGTGAVKYLNIKIGSNDYYIPLLNAVP